MVAKLVAKGIVRDVAIRKMKAALEGIYIEGLKTNIPLHKAILRNETFMKGKYSTQFIGDENPQSEVSTNFDYERVYRILGGVEARRIGM